MGKAPHTLDGWYTLHDFRTIDWSRLKSLAPSERQHIIEEFLDLYGSFRTINGTRKGSFGAYSIVGHKADLLFLHMRPTVEELIDLKTELNKTEMANYLTSSYSYFSIVELGGYLAKPGVDIETDEYLQSRLKPELPETSHVCFYPMNKRRIGSDNWYMLSAEERRDLMQNHGMIGREYANHVKQIISGSVGFDDWEWGVTLFGDDPLQFKKLIYEMRFDEGSARFAEFGPFLVGTRLTEQKVQSLLTIHA